MTFASVAPVLWLLIVLFSLLMYMALDGYDLGIGMLLLLERDDTRRKEMMEIVATGWDGNESWLILVGVGLFGGFPLAYSTLLPALYIPFILMLFALIFRGISIEFQAQSATYQRTWALAFALGSLVATVCQGVILGAVLSGIPVVHGQFVGTPFGFLNGLSLLTSLFVLAAYCLSGATWLNDKTEGILAATSKQRGLLLSLIVGVLLILTLIVAFLTRPVASTPSQIGLLLIGVAAVLALVALGVLRRVLKNTDGIQPFLLAAGALVLSVVGLLALNYPYLVPPSLTIWQAASSGTSVNFLLLGVGLCIPIVLVYNGYAYYVFRGKFTIPQEKKA